MARNKIEFTAFVNHGVLSTSNANLDGTGTLLELGFRSGTETYQINSLFIKAIGLTTEGLVRIFVNDGTNSRLIKEIYVPYNSPNGSTRSFGKIIRFKKSEFVLQPTYKIKMSTQNAEVFSVVANGTKMIFPSTERKLESTARTSMVVINTANSYLDGTGTLGTLLTNGTGINGTIVKTITIKSVWNTQLGMVRLFYKAGASTRLLYEVKIPQTTQASVQPTFARKIVFGSEGFFMPTSADLLVSTEKNDTFNVVAEGFDWTYV